jgi:hypothetical protein
MPLTELAAHMRETIRLRDVQRTERARDDAIREE